MVDNVIRMMERYSNHLKEMVEEKTLQVAEEKRKSEALLYRMLPVYVTIHKYHFCLIPLFNLTNITYVLLASSTTKFQVLARWSKIR